MQTTRRLGLLWAALLVSGCKNTPGLDVPDLNHGSLTELQSNPTPSAVSTAAQGLLGIRDVAGGYVWILGELGRESYNLDPANLQNNILLTGPLSGFFSFAWGTGYRYLKQGSVVLKAVDAVTGMDPADKEAVRGFTKTIQALALLIVINTTDDAGAVINVDRDVGADLAPIVTKAEVFQRIVQLLDEAQTHLQAAGASFPLTLGSGFVGFDTPATFLKFNRGLKARVDVYLANYGAALTDLNASFLDTGAPLTLGVYNPFSTNSGDQSNRLYDPVPKSFFAHQSTVPDAQLRTDGSKDLRAQAKVAAVPPQTTFGITVDLKFTIYNNPSAPISVIRNEELILLRAEAQLGLGNTAAAIQDINFIRVNSGGLAPIADPYVPAAGQPPTLLDELLYEKRYSLLWEGHRLIDMRRYGLLDQLPKYAPSHKIFPRLPLPVDECAARSPQPAGCAEVPGI